MTNQPHHSGAGRHWRRSRYWTGDEYVTGHKISCSIEGCDSHRILPDRNERQIPPDQVELRLRREGWHVAKKSRGDKCPGCVKKEMDAKRMKHAATVKLIVNNDQPLGEPEVAQANTAPAAQELTRDSRRIIMMKLDETYESAEKGYKAPWTDQVVAKDLGVPLAWVVALRDEFFGPARDNEEIRELLAEIRKQGEVVATTITSAEEMMRAGTSLQGKLLNMNGTLSETKRVLEALLKRADQIAKTVQT